MKSPIRVQVIGSTFLRTGYHQLLQVEPDICLVPESGDVQLITGARWIPNPAGNHTSNGASDLPPRVVVIRYGAEEMEQAWACGIRVFVGEDDPPEVLCLAIAAAAMNAHFCSPALLEKSHSNLEPRCSARRAQSPDGLTRRERQALRLLESGLSYKEIAENLGVGIETVKTHLKRARQNCANRKASAD